MTAVETKLEMAERHVRDGERLVANQREVLARLREDGHSTDLAERLLANLEELLAMHQEHLAQIRAEQ